MTASGRRLDSPWSPQARWLTTCCCAVGVTLLAIAFAGSQAQDDIRAQTPWLDLAVLGSIAAAAGQAAWLVHGHRAISRLRRRWLASRATTMSTTSPPVIGQLGLGVVMLPGSTWSHRADCLLVVRKPVDLPPPMAALDPCPVCRD